MKIKLVTFAPHPNYGTCLQSYALNKELTKMGHDVEFIYNGRENPPVSLIDIIKKGIKKIPVLSQIATTIRSRQLEERNKNGMYEPTPYILELPSHRILYVLSKMPFYDRFYKFFYATNRQKRKIYSYTFEEGNYNMKRLYVRTQYNDVVKDADLFITGSDQIWNPFCGGFNPMMFLEFAGDKKRVAYSSSIARTSFPKSVEQRAKTDLAKFSHIAVREQSSVDYLNGILGRQDVQLVVDPTYLLSKDEWYEFGERANVEFKVPKKYIFCYFIGRERIDEYREMIEDVKKQTGITEVITMNCTTNNENVGGGLFYKDGGPYEFVYLLSHASILCADSFHATIFALKFGVDFVHILKSKEDKIVGSQNSRMYDMLGRYGILYKLYTKENKNWNKKVDFNQVNSIMNKEIEESKNYLVKALSS